MQLGLGEITILFTGFQQIGQHTETMLANQLSREIRQMQNTRERVVQSMFFGERARVMLIGNRFHQLPRHVPFLEQCRGELNVVKAKGLGFDLAKISAGFGRANEHHGIRGSQLFSKDQNSQALKKSYQKCFIARCLKKLLADFARRHGPRECRRPIPLERFTGDVGEQVIGQAEAEHQNLEWLDPQERDRLVKIAHFAGQAEQRTIHDAQHLGGERGIAQDAFLDRLGRDPRITREL